MILIMRSAILKLYSNDSSLAYKFGGYIWLALDLNPEGKEHCNSEDNKQSERSHKKSHISNIQKDIDEHINQAHEETNSSNSLFIMYNSIKVECYHSQNKYS